LGGEQHILAKVARGLSNAEIVAELFLTDGTVKTCPSPAGHVSFRRRMTAHTLTTGTHGGVREPHASSDAFFGAGVGLHGRGPSRNFDS
jgi:hypothetical protein